MNRASRLLLVTGLSAAIAAAGLYAITGRYGFSVLTNRGMTTWTVVKADDPRLSPAMRLALRSPPPQAQLAVFSWQQVEPGLEVAEAPILAEGGEVDRLLLTRIAPDKFTFEVLNDPTASLEVDDWQKTTGAAVVINGSYYGPAALPDTPVISNGRKLGPQSYDGRHGAFVTDGAASKIVDLAHTSWQDAFSGATNAFVNYPMLVGEDGSARVQHTDDRKLANRSFIAQDGQGNIVLGTTREAFLSLRRLAELLRGAPLDLKLALNLDGGPPACQAVATPSFTRSFCGKWETQVHDGQIVLLGHLLGDARWKLPTVIVAKRRATATP